MSNLVVSNISDGSTSVGTEYVVNGSVKAWCKLNMTGAAAITNSFNISSISDLGVGDFTASFSSAFSSVNYTPTIGNYAAALGTLIVSDNTASIANVSNYGDAGTRTDSAKTYFATHGDLA